MLRSLFTLKSGPWGYRAVLEPGWGLCGHLPALMVLPCLSADLISSFLLIFMLFAISLSLLIGVIKVRGWTGGGSKGFAPRASCPSWVGI